jgi:hypothetical protein
MVSELDASSTENARTNLLSMRDLTLRYMSASIFLGEHDIHLSQFSHCTIAFSFMS